MLEGAGDTIAREVMFVVAAVLFIAIVAVAHADFAVSTSDAAAARRT